ncbi:MAG: alpha/beta fold hydrolase [Parvibaculaceae bacterium]
MGAEVSHRDVPFTSADGLALHGRDYPASGDATPILCLAGLTRSSRDFEPLAQWLGGTRRLVTMDYRGRGRSAHAADPLTYRPDVELADALRLLDHLGIERVNIIGTSRGGIIAMIMAAQYPQRLTGVLLNDVGPVIERSSLLRIRSYLGKALAFTNWDDAVNALKDSNPGFESLSEAEWLSFARRVFIEKDGRISHDYDLRLAQTFPTDEEIAKADSPDLWPLFDMLMAFPVMVLRAENSDLLSAATVAQMKKRHPRLAAQTIRNRGHVPFLDEPDAKAAIRAWLEIV